MEGVRSRRALEVIRSRESGSAGANGTDLCEAFRTLTSAEPRRVAIVGDVILDRYVWGRASRVSPEAPIPVVSVERENARLGGAGNVAANAAALGAGVDLVAAIGHDPAGQEVKALLDGISCHTEFVVGVGGRPTTVKTRVIANRQQLVRVDHEDVGPLPGPAGRLDLALEKTIARADAVIISDYGKGLCTPMFLSRVIAMGRRRGVPVLVDPKGNDYGKYANAHWITPNLMEVSHVSNVGEGDDDDVARVAAAVRERFNIKNVLITRGSKGMTLSRPDAAHHIRSEAREVFDVSGAGDTVIGVLAVALAAGLDPDAACRLANVAAGVVVGKVGTTPVTLDELAETVGANDRD